MAEAHAEMPHGSGNPNEVAHEPLPLKIYLGVAAALLVLTGVTVGVAMVDFGGHWNLVVAMLVASIKASLVVLYFMNLRYDHDRINAVIFMTSVVFLIVYFTFTLADGFTRGKVDPVRGQAAPLELRIPEPARGGVTPPTAPMSATGVAPAPAAPPAPGTPAK